MKLKLGIEKYNEGKFEEALGIFHELVSESPSNATYRIHRARVFSRLGKYELSLTDFNDALSLLPYDCDVISDRAVVLHLMGRHEEALSELNKAQNLDPKNPYRYSSRAFLKDRMGDLHGAVEDYETAISLDPEDAISLNNKGLVEEKLGYQSRSRESFAKADKIIGYTPSSPNEHQEYPKKEPANQTAETGDDQRLTLSGFSQTLKNLVLRGDTRKEFWQFVQNKLKRS